MSGRRPQATEPYQRVPRVDVKKVPTAIGILFSIGYVIFRYRYYAGHEVYFNLAGGLFFFYTAFEIFRMVQNRDRSLGAMLTFEKFAVERFGQRFGRYLVYEVKLIMGVFKFLASPIKSYKALMASYFASPMLSGLLLGLALVMSIEPVLIHILVDAKLTGMWKIVAHIALILSEIFLLEILLGNLYYIQFTKVVIGPEALDIELGLLWKIHVERSNIKQIELGNQRQFEDKTAKISLLNSPTVRLHFQEPVSAQRLFKFVSIRTIDVYLSEADSLSIQPEKGATC